jgi:thioredoxin reductase
MGEFVAADDTGLTDVPGLWVAGNVTDLAAAVVSAAAQGVSAAAAINATWSPRRPVVRSAPSVPGLPLR